MDMTDFRTLSHNDLKIKFSKYGYASIDWCKYIVRLQIFCWSKLLIEVIAKNENLKSYKKTCYCYLEVWIQWNSRTRFRVNPHSTCLNIKELFAQNRCEIWGLSAYNGARTHNHLVPKRTLSHLAKLAVGLSPVAVTMKLLMNLLI